ncbi:hypothetical protein DMENIID0001_136950 [Sergentomyia squamirostris]
MYKTCFLTKTLEAVLSLVCLVIHISGFLRKDEPLPHQFIFCGTFFGAFLVSLVGAISLVIRFEVSIFYEIGLSGFFFLLFLTTALVSMANAEKDIHLLFLTDQEEGEHAFFWINRCQSLFALTTSLIYLLHFMICLDLILITKEIEMPEGDLTLLEQKDVDALRPVKLKLAFANWVYSKFTPAYQWSEEEEQESDEESTLV